MKPTLLLASLALLSGCGNGGSGGPSDSGSGTDSGSGHDAAQDASVKPDAPADAATDSMGTPDAPSDGGGMHTVTFSYTPEWTGATAVTVIGGFGQSTDWMPGTPFLTLTSDGKGGFTGTAELATGTYLYVFQVTGDTAAADPTTFQRYVIDPTEPDYDACPAASPTYDKNDPNPCSELTVPQPAAATLYHITGKVTYDGAAKGGYLVLLERDEKSSHHFPVNRTTSTKAGDFDVEMAKGTYRIQVQYPTFISKTDAERDPLKLLAVRRSISAAAPITASTAFPTVDVAYKDYDKMSPIDGSAPLPATFDYTVIAGASDAYLAVYGPGANIGDPWYMGASGTAKSATFDGGFNTKQATQPSAEAGTKYAWGTWQVFPSDGGVQWKGESMVFPVTFE
jgi:hypothetical protein